MSLSTFRDLRVWMLGMDLVEEIYRLTRDFPRHETYGLGGQLQRASVSIPSNIAEGYVRRHRKEYLQHLSMAQASLAEIDTQLEIAVRLGYLPPEQDTRVREQVTSLGKQLYNLRRSLSAEYAKIGE